MASPASFVFDVSLEPTEEDLEKKTLEIYRMHRLLNVDGFGR